MSEYKHTSGPWRLAENDASLVITEALDLEGNCQVVADVINAPGPVTKIQLADARLIAAAPEMLDELRIELEAVLDDIRWADGAGELERLLARRDRLSAVIAKATGEE